MKGASPACPGPLGNPIGTVLDSLLLRVPHVRPARANVGFLS